MSTRTITLWLALGAVYGVAVGLWLVLVGLFPEALGLADTKALLFIQDPASAGDITNISRLAVAVSGALTAGFGVFAWGLRPMVQGRAGVEQAGTALFQGMMFWFVVDSVASVWVGAPMNALGNVTYLVALAPPAWAFSRMGRLKVRATEAGPLPHPGPPPQ